MSRPGDTRRSRLLGCSVRSVGLRVRSVLEAASLSMDVGVPVPLRGISR
jgi:hypothetical protein